MARSPATGIITGTLDINTLLSFAFGVTFLVVMLIFATNYPNPTPFQVWVYITTLALAAAGVGAMLPGRFDIRYKNVVRAGGALGLFAAVFFNQPTITKATATLI